MLIGVILIIEIFVFLFYDSTCDLCFGMFCGGESVIRIPASHPPRGYFGGTE
jgi:hypothetical protein